MVTCSIPDTASRGRILSMRAIPLFVRRHYVCPRTAGPGRPAAARHSRSPGYGRQASEVYVYADRRPVAI
jgi:hypothetical protein